MLIFEIVVFVVVTIVGLAAVVLWLAHHGPRS